MTPDEIRKRLKKEKVNISTLSMDVRIPYQTLYHFIRKKESGLSIKNRDTLTKYLIENFFTDDEKEEYIRKTISDCAELVMKEISWKII